MKCRGMGAAKKGGKYKGYADGGCVSSKKKPKKMRKFAAAGSVKEVEEAKEAAKGDPTYYSERQKRINKMIDKAKATRKKNMAGKEDKPKSTAVKYMSGDVTRERVEKATGKKRGGKVCK